MGDPVADRDLWQDRSPLFFANRIRAPLLLLAGQNDIRCPVKETEQMAEAARKNGVTVDVKIYENEGHGFVRRENEIYAIQRAAKIRETHLHQRAAHGSALDPAVAWSRCAYSVCNDYILNISIYDPSSF